MSSLEEIHDNFKVIKKIIKDKEGNETIVDLRRIEKIIEKTLPEGLEKNAPPNFPELYFDFRYEFEKFRDYVLYKHLIGKSIVALGGGFSSGKSSFLNSLIKKPILPSEIDPSTSVPAYVVQDKESIVYGINIFNAVCELDFPDVKLISHGFGEVRDEDEEIVEPGVSLGHLLKSIFIATPLQGYDNLAFLDTPGYSKPETQYYSAKTDEKIARAQLNSSNYILWFVPADAGTISEEDIKFLSSLDGGIPKLIIVNKADKKLPEEIELIVKKIRDVLDIKGVRYLDVLAYSRNKPKDFAAELINERFMLWNQEKQKANFAYNFKRLFVKCKEYYQDLLEDENRTLNRVNIALTLTDDSTINSCLQDLSKDARKNSVESKDLMQKLKQIQDEFFHEIKIVADSVGVSMPEPSEIDLLEGNYSDPLDVLRKYRQKKGQASDNKLAELLGDLLERVNPVLKQQAGDSEYRNVLSNMIQERLDRETNISHCKLRSGLAEIIQENLRPETIALNQETKTEKNRIIREQMKTLNNAKARSAKR